MKAKPSILYRIFLCATMLSIQNLWAMEAEQDEVGECIDKILALTPSDKIRALGGISVRNERMRDHISNGNFLSISDFKIPGIPSEIGNLTNLTKLSLEQNPVSILPSEIMKLTNLVTLDFSHTNVDIIPLGICNLINLSYLSFSHTKVMILPFVIGNLTNLTKLVLSYTPVNCLPAEIGDLVNLNTIYFNDTRVKEIPSEVGKLTNLTELHCSNTGISILPGEMENLTNLTKLFILKTPFTRKLSLFVAHCLVPSQFQLLPSWYLTLFLDDIREQWSQLDLQHHFIYQKSLKQAMVLMANEQASEDAGSHLHLLLPELRGGILWNLAALAHQEWICYFRQKTHT